MADDRAIEQAGKEMVAMAEIGRRRSREGVISFAAAWALVTVGAALALGRGLGLFLGGIAAYFISKEWVKSRNPVIVAEVAKRHGLTPESLQAHKYLID